jgi:hypothetical protein
MENSNKNSIHGNLYWVFETLKKVNNDFNFDLPIKVTQNNEIVLYECIVFHPDKEDSLFVQYDDKLYEYFSNDKCNIILKLIKIFKHKFCKTKKNEVIKDNKIKANLHLVYNDNTSKSI